jgi:phosphoribosylanthranilate isomerase
MSMIEKVQQVELRVKKAALLIEQQRKEIADLKQSLELVQMHNEELQKYADSYKEDTKLIEESIAKSLDTLDAIDGLDNLDTIGLDDFDTADSFDGGAAILDDDLSIDDLS